METKSEKPYKTRFIDSSRFMQNSLSNLVNNLAERVQKNKSKYEYDNKESEKCGFKYKNCECFLEYINFKDDLIEYKCLCCNKNYQKKFP